MRSRLGLLALAPIVLTLQGCPAPPNATISITNNSGQRLAFASCRGEKFNLAPGETAELLNWYSAFGGPEAWECYYRRPLVLVTEQGEDWTYTLWFNRNFSGAPQRYRPFADFEAPRKREGYSGVLRTYVAIEIRSDGSIGAGDYTGDRYFDRKVKPTFPRDPQPAGFPIVPKRSPHVAKRK